MERATRDAIERLHLEGRRIDSRKGLDTDELGRVVALDSYEARARAIEEQLVRAEGVHREGVGCFVCICCMHCLDKM